VKRATKVRGTVNGFSGRRVAVKAEQSMGKVAAVQLDLTGPQGAQFAVWLSTRSAARLCRLLELALGLGLAIASGAGCGDDRAPAPKPDAGVYLDACDPTVSRTCAGPDAGAKP
jgi:hypothetical protein